MSQKMSNNKFKILKTKNKAKIKKKNILTKNLLKGI